jgi:hypothetical protein
MASKENKYTLHAQITMEGNQKMAKSQTAGEKRQEHKTV